MHAGARDFVCAARGCGKAYGYKHLLQRHVARVHARRSASAEDDEDEVDDNDDDVSTARNAEPSASSSKAKSSSAIERSVPSSSTIEKRVTGDIIDEITGAAYARAARTTRALPCPYPSFTGLPHALLPANETDVEITDHERQTSPQATAPKTCEYTFSRAYDLRRHVRAVHDVELAKADVDAWAQGLRGTKV